MDVTVKWGVTRKHRETVAEILYDSLHSKLTKVFGPRRRRVHIIAKSLQDDRILLALSNDQVIGVAGLKFDNKEYIYPKPCFLLRIYGLDVFRVIFNGWILRSHVKKDELYLATIAVSEAWRGKGVGTKLFNETIFRP
ncbi:MAG: GNAT family N-acetyltransferase [Candidatus Ranarchaeia archaeon]